MGHRRLAKAGAGAVIIVAAGLIFSPGPSAGQAPLSEPYTGAPEGWETPRTPWGDPDLQGIWDGGSIMPLERPEEYADREFLTEEEVAALEADSIANPGRDARLDDALEDLAGAYNDVYTHRRDNYARTRRTSRIIDPPNGRLPALTPEGEARRQAERERARRQVEVTEAGASVSFGVDAAISDTIRRTGAFDNPEDRHRDRCMGISIPAISPMRIVQSPGRVSIYYEYAIGGGAHRSIPLDDRPHLPPHIREKLGDSIGRWEGDTLVVDTTNFSREASLPAGASENLHLIERFTPAADDLLLYHITVDDPTVFTSQWTQEVPLEELSNKESLIFESACHEGNHYAMLGILAGARARDDR